MGIGANWCQSTDLAPMFTRIYCYNFYARYNTGEIVDSFIFVLSKCYSIMFYFVVCPSGCSLFNELLIRINYHEKII